MPEVELILIERSAAGRRIVAHGTPREVSIAALDRCTDKELYAFKLDTITRLQLARRVAEEAALTGADDATCTRNAGHG